jgi:hypothetical protein
MVTRATTTLGPVSWGAIIGGVFVALVVHILLNMVGADIGAASVDVGDKSAAAVQTLSWSAFAWWSISFGDLSLPSTIGIPVKPSQPTHAV